MNNEDLALKQRSLLARSAQLRRDVAVESATWHRSLAFIDRVANGLRWLYRHPRWPLGAVLLVALRRPRRTITWGMRIWWIWSAATRLRQRFSSNPIQWLRT